MCYREPLQKSKATDEKGTKVGELKECDIETEELIRDTFNMIIGQDPWQLANCGLPVGEALQEKAG